MDGVRYKCNSTLDQVGVELGSKLYPKIFLSSAFWAKRTAVLRWSTKMNQ
jgi:hypothetical protein